ncbi:alpha/beta hydrolase [Ruminiclostridium cellobioparum]|uniref:Lysophospholipase n=1 Tax=Ruminiclostridium cellobioparum subsp. termitidis CT1112 TaxID=1195236 RepID=S0FQ93_RUMCE|nr:alpha/beta fold hydrolase [Ruminiclostridium cellobioparum]EMS72536.1 Lysophospholipase [Ruminiclostridium cellobioparum subsp. termitidis CT1112]
MRAEKMEFKNGDYSLNSQANFNFQLNRMIMWDGGELADIEEISPLIKDSSSWKQNLISIGDKAISEGRTKEAIAYYRMSEFFMYDGDPDKEKYYTLASDLFYEYYGEYFEDGTVVRYFVPFEDIVLPVMYAKAKGGRKDIILLHGGNDSYFEEFFFPMLYFSENGYDVYLFEGPGQGGVMRKQGKHFIYQWERPVKAILDFFKLDEVTIIGASLGGMLAPRAAALEKRIHRVIAWSVFTNFMDILISTQPMGTRKILKILFKLRMKSVINFVFNLKMKKGDELVKWGLMHGMYAYESRTPYEYLDKMNRYQIMDVASLIDQDMLIIGANRDHFIDYRIVGQEIDALKNVRSLTVRIFTDKENAGAHCNVGNAGLVFNTMINWIEAIKNK